MRRVAVTGGRGFLGWHTRAALRERELDADLVQLGAGYTQEEAARAVSGTERLIHLAGVNRAPDDDVSSGNILFAEQAAAALVQADRPPHTVVYANSTQAGNGTVYGEAKARAGEILGRAAQRVGAEYQNVELPNLFGEHGKPFYNSVTATFCHLLSKEQEPTVEADKTLSLLHAQDAADLLTGVAETSELATLVSQETVSGLLGRLRRHAELYRQGQIPDIAQKFDRDLFNTYRSFVVDSLPINLTRHADARGSFFEILRSHGGSGQASFSTTEPGVSRGDHFHRRKVERFTVLAGHAIISLRKILGGEVISFEVNGDEPVAVDMPTMWAHRISNVGSDPLYTSFWTDDLFDPANPDTIGEVV